MTVRERIGNGATRAAGTVAHTHRQTVGPVVRRLSSRLELVAEQCADRAHAAVGTSPTSRHHRAFAPLTVRGAARHALRRRGRQLAHRHAPGAVRAARRARRARVAAVAFRANPAAVLVRATILRPLRALTTTLVAVLLVLWLLWELLVPGVAKGPLRALGGRIVPSSYGTCAPTQEPVGGVASIGWKAGEAARTVATLEPTAEQVSHVLDEVAVGAGRLLFWLRQGLAGAAEPTRPAVPQEPDVQAVPDEAGLPMDAASAVLGSPWQATPQEHQETAVAIAQAESGDDPAAVNPKKIDGDQAHGLWQIMLPMHADKFDKGKADQWADPVQNARAALHVRDRQGFDAWDVYRSGAYKQHLPAARRALELAAGGTVAPSSLACAPAVPGTVSAGLDTGDHQNGRLPADALQALSWAPEQQLRPDAAAALERLNVAYRQRFGRDLAVTDTYRDYAGQVAVRRAKPHLAAVPGTSNHGWGVAVDLNGGVERFGTPEHRWFVATGPAYGWHHPEWARQDGSKPEPWHHEMLVGAVSGTERVT